MCLYGESQVFLLYPLERLSSNTPVHFYGLLKFRLHRAVELWCKTILNCAWHKRRVIWWRCYSLTAEIVISNSLRAAAPVQYVQLGNSSFPAHSSPYEMRRTSLGAFFLLSLLMAAEKGTAILARRTLCLVRIWIIGEELPEVANTSLFSSRLCRLCAF
jgi:hypothetical protein